MIDIRKALEEGLLDLDKTNPESRLETELLLCQALNKNRAYLFAHPEQILSQTELDTYRKFITQRALGTPISYITGTREFWSLSLLVNPHTLIPRHETELLVELALELIPNEPGTQIIDLGTGSGAIALALAKERPHWHIDACDKSEDALLIAQQNATNNNITNVSFYHSDWFKQLPAKRYHALVSNPPYIAADDPHLKQGDLRFEPESALVSSQEGLADLQYIIQHAKDWLLPKGLLLLEHGFLQKPYLKAILNKLGYSNTNCWQDVQGHDRVSGGWRPGN